MCLCIQVISIYVHISVLLYHHLFVQYRDICQILGGTLHNEFLNPVPTVPQRADIHHFMNG